MLMCGVILISHPPYSLRQGLLLTDVASPASQLAQETSVLTSTFGDRDYRPIAMSTQHCCGHRSSGLQGRYFNY